MTTWRSRLGCWLTALLLLAAAPVRAADDTALHARAVAPDVWFVQGEAALGTMANRNFISNAGFVDRDTDVCVIPPNSFALARTVEYFRIPRDTLVVCLGKSTYARCGIIVNVTPLEPEWEGHVTLEFSNTTPLPARIYANEGVAQMLFFQADADDVCETSYKDRGGKYQGQTGVTLPKI